MGGVSEDENENLPSKDRDVLVVVAGLAWKSGLSYCKNKENEAQDPEIWPGISSACILTLFPSLIQSTDVCEDGEVSNV